MKDYFAYLKATERSFSLRKLSMKCGLTASSLYMAISKERPLSEENLKRILSELDLNVSESNFLKVLRELAESDSPDNRIQCYNRMMRFIEYKHKAKADIRVYKYISAWYHIVIREMTKIKGFSLSSKWIQKSLIPKMSIKDIKKALEFLKESNFVEESKDGEIQLPDPTIQCEKEVMGIALAQAHEQTLEIAAKSIDAVPSEERQLLTYTTAVSTDQIEEIHKVMASAMAEVQSIVEAGSEQDAVYQFSFLSVPMAKKNGASE